jgi:hypothetical protein
LLSSDDDEFGPYATSISEKLAAGGVLSPGERRFLSMIEAAVATSNFWIDRRWNHQQRIGVDPS